MESFSSLSTAGILFYIVLLVWTLIWKGLALWKAARRNDSVWYIVLLILNTAGLLEIIYYFFIGKGEKKAKE